MNRIAAGITLLLMIVVGAVSVNGQEKKSVELKSFKEKLSYSMGLDVGTYFKSIDTEIDFQILIKGIEDGFHGKKSLLSVEEVTATQKEFTEKMRARQEQALQEMKEKNTKEGAVFLETNKKKKGVTVTKSGLQIEVLKKGKGPKPAATDKVKVDYIGTLIDGKEFDNSIKRGEPAVFGVDQVIPGWSEALQLMDVGSKVRLVVPPELAYGETGAPPVIEPNSVLVFEVELHSIEK